MAECGDFVISDLCISDLGKDKLGKFRSYERIVHVAAACSKPDLTCISILDLAGFDVVFIDLDLVRTARFVNRLKTDQEASVLLSPASARSNLIAVLNERTSDNTSLVGVSEHTKLGAPLEDHLISENAVKCNCHTFLFYQM